MSKNYENTIAYSPLWKEKSGKLDFSMSNDYLFRALLQKDEKTLKLIVASFLQVSVESISDIEITNPILLGADINDKEYHLDIHTLLDHERVIDLEMQVLRHKGWTERTLVYVCRAFDELNHGNNYADAKSVWQISFCGFTLFEEEPEFVSDYMLINKRKPDQLYSDKIRITNVNLSRIDLATEEDIRSGIACWARLFTAESWEDLKMIEKENPVMGQTISSIYQLTSDEIVRKQMLRREENERLHRSMMQDYEDMKQQVEEMRNLYNSMKSEYDGMKSEYDGIKSEYDGIKSEYTNLVNENKKVLEENRKLHEELSNLKR